MDTKLSEAIQILESRIDDPRTEKVTFESFHRVEVATCLPVQWQP
jgi:hypothetical protein